MSKISAFVMAIGMSIAITIPSALCGSMRQRQAKPSNVDNAWALPTFHGLHIGVSTTQDVLRVFGKPDSKGPSFDTLLESDKEGEIEYEYSKVPDIDGDVDVLFSKRTGVLSAILVYPKHMTRAEAITDFGSDFEESNNKLGACPTARERELVRKAIERDHQKTNPVLLYPKLGVYVDLNDDGTVHIIAYQKTCR
jgi:hypothetical protein